MDQEFRGVCQPASPLSATGLVLQVINRGWVMKTVAVPEWIGDLFVWYDRENNDLNPA